MLIEQVGGSEFRFSAPMQKLRETWQEVAGVELGGAQGFAIPKSELKVQWVILS